jgi:chromatin remodeling complex protein RSC6
MKPEHYQMLAEAKMTVEQIGVVMRIMAEAEDAMKVAEEARKSVARERVQRWREKQKDAVTLPKDNCNATVRLTRVEDSSSKKDISGKEEKKEGRSQATRLPADWTLPNDWLQDALRAGMDIPQALASAARMHNWSLSDMKGKKLDWRATWRNWFQRDLPKPHSTASPAPRNAGERAFLRLQAENGHDPTDTISKRLEPGDGRRQIEGNGDAWPLAGAQGAFGGN